MFSIYIIYVVHIIKHTLIPPNRHFTYIMLMLSLSYYVEFRTLFAVPWRFRAFAFRGIPRRAQFPRALFAAVTAAL